MTDARIPDRWLSDRRLQRLSDAHFRSYINALTWAVTNRTDGVIEPHDIDFIPHFTASAPEAFVASGLWTRLDEGWLITDYLATQTSREQLEAAEAARKREREKKAQQRAKAAKKAAQKSAGEHDVPGDSPGDSLGGRPGGQHRTGQERTGKEREGAPDSDVDSAVVDAQQTNGYGPEPQWCWGCGDGAPVGAEGRDMDDPTLCRGCNDERMAEAGEWIDGEP